ncbi:MULTISPECIES: hypothetical protein [unclassified Shinella]|uniref:hypothetical protein n=1 Tax=unclassified Shinella TaxID=2643062 RepID=UPI00225D7792|nr:MULTISPECIES: hypothetical protein [unclassified Shinella]MCO5138317.1 hypothetical protein [Shinella sp.]MDC7255154.1 hypothetical protein [Shinella sp. YE25]CAI0337916.1 conserved hypothetical protein [Rhizobiaceae bacterium]CAK7256383.1 conserved protein of unknown function [Shinella sp. WSC3-e]
MGKLINKILGKQSSADIASAITKAQAELEAAEAAVTAAEAAYDDGLLTLDKAALRKLLDAKVEAGIEIDQIRAQLAKLERQHADALEAEAADQRQRRYDEAKAASDAAEKRLRKEYPRAAMAIRDLLAEVAAASIAVQAANEDPPEGAPAILGPEYGRSQHPKYQEVISEDIVEMWTDIDGTSPIRDDLQSRVRAHEKNRRGMMRDRSDSDERPLQYGSVQTEHGVLEVVRKRFRRAKILPDQAGYSTAPLGCEIVLPPLDAGATPFWKPAYDQRDAAAQAAAELKPAPKRPERVAEYSYSLAPKETANV